MRLSSENTAVVLDSTADLPGARERHANWRFVPLYVQFGTETFRDYVELGPAEFYEKLRTSPVTPATAQPTPQDFVSAYEGLAAYERIVCLPVAAKLSGTMESARLAADERVLLYDSGTASGGIVLLADALQRRLERGTDEAELEALVGRYHREAGLLFTVDTLEYLVRGGRVGKAAGFAGELLSVKPILTIREGEVVPLKRVRGRPKALAELEAAFAAGTADAPGLHAGVAHAEAAREAEELAAMIRRVRPQASLDLMTTLGAVVGTHAGPGTLGLFWFTDDG